MIPSLHLITDDEILARDDFPGQARRMLEEGGQDVALHLRGPGTCGRVLFDLAVALLDQSARSGSLLLINDRIDIALALGLPGVHLGQRSLPPRVARTLLGPQSLLGLSVHGAEEARTGAAASPGHADPGLDFLVVGSIFPTSSHPGRNPGGLAVLREVRAVSALPLLAIGGLTPERVEEVMAVGAHGVAVRGGAWDGEDPKAAIRVYLEEVRNRR